jgi:hypothetical protein
MWNFSGRQNDEQGHGGPLKGNWKTGINAIDAVRLGNREVLSYREASSRANNKYFLLPFLFGILGIVYLSTLGKKGNHYLREILLLLLITGPGIVLYLNQTPYEPRERDYAFVGSFFAYALFIGFGVYGFMRYAKELSKSNFSAMLAAILSFLALPGILLVNNYDDHDRSDRYLALNSAKSYLNSCDEGSVLFTYGDNDTYPLWYAQEVENVRPDLRVVNYGLMGAGWCVEQLYNKINDAPAFGLTIPKMRYKDGDLDNALLLDKSNKFADLKKVVQFIGSNKKETKLPLQNGKLIAYSPTKNFIIDNGDSTYVKWSNPKRVLYKNDIVLLDLLSNGLKDRPVYLTTGSSADIYKGLETNIERLLTVYQLTPQTAPDSSKKYIILNNMLNDYLNKVDFGKQGDAYYDNYSKNTFSILRYRRVLDILLANLIEEGRHDDAVKVIKKSLKEYPVQTDPYHDGNLSFIRLMYEAGMKKEASRYFKFLTNIHMHNLRFFANQDKRFLSLISYEVREEMSYEKKLKEALRVCRQDELLKQLDSFYE